MSAQGVQRWRNGTCPIKPYRLPKGAMYTPPDVSLPREMDIHNIHNTNKISLGQQGRTESIRPYISFWCMCVYKTLAR